MRTVPASRWADAMTEEAYEPELDDELKRWHEERRTGLGATDSPVVLGLSGSAFRLWEDKTGRGKPREQSLPMWLGLKMQATVGELYATATGRKIRADNRLHRHPSYEFIFTHLDYRTVGAEKRLVECKTSNRWNIWGAEGTSDVPPWYWVQAQHEMACTGYAVCDLAVLLGNREFRIYPIVRDGEFIEKMLAADVEFWNEHVLADVAPIDGSEEAERFLRTLYPDATEDLRPATALESQMVERFRVADAELKAAKADKAQAQQDLEDRIAEAEGIYGPGFRVTWKRNKDSTSTGWEQVATALRAHAHTAEFVEVGDGLVCASCHQPFDPATIESLYTTTSPGSRTFRATWTKPKE